MLAKIALIAIALLVAACGEKEAQAPFPASGVIELSDSFTGDFKLTDKNGGSMRDDEVIAAADDAGLAMVFTGMRHFRH